MILKFSVLSSQFSVQLKTQNLKLKTYGSVIGCLFLVGCTATAQPSPHPTPHTPHPNSSPNLITGNDSQTQGRFKIKLTLTAPDDLKVKEGDTIIAGQILADKVRDRSRLQFERENILREVARLKKGLNLPIPDVKSLPEADYTEEVAAIETARQKSLEAIRRREQQQRKIDVLLNMDQAELPEEVIPHEQILLEERQREENQSRAAVDLALGKLNKAKELRQREEYSHSLEMSKRAIAIREHELKTQGAIADLEARLSQVEVSLSQLSAVRSPYSGRIQKIKFVGQSDTSLTVELTLGVTGQRPGTIESSPQADSSPDQ